MPKQNELHYWRGAWWRLVALLASEHEKPLDIIFRSKADLIGEFVRGFLRHGILNLIVVNIPCMTLFQVVLMHFEHCQVYRKFLAFCDCLCSIPDVFEHSPPGAVQLIARVCVCEP